MTLDQIADLMRGGLARHPLEQSLCFDCGEDGRLRLHGTEVAQTADPADCTIKMTLPNLAKLVQGKLNPMTAFAMGKLKVSGDMSVAMKLSQLL